MGDDYRAGEGGLTSAVSLCCANNEEDRRRLVSLANGLSEDLTKRELAAHAGALSEVSHGVDDQMLLMLEAREHVLAELRDLRARVEALEACWWCRLRRWLRR
jgi:hypothetical protein